MKTRQLAIALPIAAAIGASRSGHQTPVTCPGGGPVVDIAASTDRAVQGSQMQLIKSTLAMPNAMVRLGPDVDLDFSQDGLDLVPLFVARCVTLTSVVSFKPVRPTVDLTTVAGATTDPGQPSGRPKSDAFDSRHPRTAVPESLPRQPEALSPHSPGPILRFGAHRDPDRAFLELGFTPDHGFSDGVRISGFQLFGPDSGPQTVSDIGIRVVNCVDIDISNMEIFGWGNAAIEIDAETGPGDRMTAADPIRVHGNYIHHNQHPNEGGNADIVVGGYAVANFLFGVEGLLTWKEAGPDKFSAGHALGYGVEVGGGAWAEISENVFDMNRHAITAGADAGGYFAERNLVLKGGGHHDSEVETYTQIFDVHGTDGCWGGDHNCGMAATEILYRWNAFQYRSGYDIKLRGMPRHWAKITANVFARTGLEGHLVGGDDAIALQTNDSVLIMANNTTGFDSFGQYGVCDFDGDGVDDLFLPTGVTWWFSSGGRYPWSYLNQRPERLEQVRFGYFDGDNRCDVMVEQGGQWLLFSGGQGPARPRGNFGASLDSVVFGRFDPSQRDHRPGVTLPTTHAFRRLSDGQWQVTTFATPDWKSIASSDFPMSELRFGDFTGDGVTDVLAVENGHWAISESGSQTWREINQTLGDPVGNLIIANMDADDNIDDLLRLDRETSLPDPNNPKFMRVHLTWWRSRNGIEPWVKWREYDFSYDGSPERVPPLLGFAGRFGRQTGPRGETMVIDDTRMGHFFRPAIAAADTISAVAY